MACIETISKETLFGCSLIGIVVLDTSGTVAVLNDKAASMFGGRAAEITGKSFDSLIRDEDTHMIDLLKENLKSGKPFSGVMLRIRRADGDSLSVRLTAGYLMGTDGVSGYLAYLQEQEIKPAVGDGDDKTEFLCNIFHGIQDAVVINSTDGKILSYNTKTLMLLDTDMESIEKAGKLENFSPEDMNRDAFRNYYNEAMGGGDVTFTWQLKRPDGTVIDVEIFMSRISRTGQGVLLVCIKDITDKKRIEDELINSEKRYRQLVEHSPDGIVIHRDGIIKYVNPAGAKIFGGREEDVLGRSVMEFFPEEDRDGLKDRLRRLYQEEVSMPLMEGRMVCLDGRPIFVEYTAIPFRLDGRTAVQVVIRDVTEKKIQGEYIRHMALHDTLTGLPNRGLLTDRVTHSLERRKRDTLKSAVLYIDLDGFKPVNDTLGHSAGDTALKEIAKRLNDSIRKSDTAARIGGDEFVILLDGVHGKPEVEQIAERVLNAINEELIIEKTVFHVGASIGISIYPDDSTDPARLLALADRAMYHVKETGKNRFMFSSRTE